MRNKDDDLQDVIARMNRLETGLGVQIDRFIKSEQTLAKAGKELMLEVEQLKAVKHSLTHTIPEMFKTVLERQVQLMVPKLIPPLAKEFHKVTSSSLENAEELKIRLDNAVSETDGIMTLQKRAMTIRGIGLSILFCFSSLLTAGGIFYFFPQNVTYGITRPMAVRMVLGDAFSENANKINREQRDLIFKKAREKLNKPQK
jgi:hypothetical protein